MPQAWSEKDEDQYDSIRESAMKRGRSKERAEELAARTVNKRRRREGRTPNMSSQGTGNPNSPLEDRTRKELYNRARELDIEGRSNMKKSELVKAIRSRNG